MNAKPGRPRSMTLEQIAQAAVDDGIASFSMPSVARRLGVAHSALYRYVTDREELLVLAIERVVAEIEWPDADQPWDDLLRAVGDQIWVACERHPGFDRAALNSTRAAERATAGVGRYVTALQEQGFPHEDAAVAVDFVIRVALWSSAEMARLKRLGGPDENTPAELKPFTSNEAWTGRGWYDRQLAIVLGGLAATRVTV